MSTGKQLTVTGGPLYAVDTPATWAQVLKDVVSPETVHIETAVPMTLFEAFIDTAVRHGEWTPPPGWRIVRGRVVRDDRAEAARA